jgi:AcrR family transcriptional regulator
MIKFIAATAGVDKETLIRHFGFKGKLLLAAIEQCGGPALVPAV